jgi:HlyD family secretion protein
MGKLKITASVLAGLAALATIVWALRPDPLGVDLALVTRGAMEVTVDAEGITRVRDPWLVTAPITGTVGRLPVRAGDRVVAAQTEVARITPAEPALLDARARLQAEAAVAEAEAAVRLAEAVLAQAASDAEFAAGEFARNRALAERGTIPRRALESSEQAAVATEAALRAAREEVELRRASLARASAQLFGPESGEAASSSTCCVTIRAPASGIVLGVEDPSARLVQAGQPLLSIGDLDDLAIEVDLLSTDAVRVAPGDRAYVERWGGEGTLEARVERIEPAGFARVSALGIEEQRVRLHLDFVSPPDDRPGLGDRFRVHVRIVVWGVADTLMVPQAALFRSGAGWAVFVESGGRARMRPVGIGQGNDSVAEVLAGLVDGERVILYPGNRIGEGDRVAERQID